MRLTFQLDVSEPEVLPQNAPMVLAEELSHVTAVGEDPVTLMVTMDALETGWARRGIRELCYRFATSYHNRLAGLRCLLRSLETTDTAGPVSNGLDAEVLMKRSILAFATAALIAPAAQAADLGSPRTPVSAAVVSPAFSWTGFYVGAHAGYGWGSHSLTGVVPLNSGGPFIGGQVGFNYQMNRLVLGAEADLSFAALSGTWTAGQFYHRSTMLGSARLRAGVAIDRALLYVTGGLGVQSASDGFHTAVLAANRYTKAGWTVGAGVEYALTANWTTKLEYSYYNFGTYNYVGPFLGGFIRTNVHTVKVGVNYLFSTGPTAVVARY